MRRFQPNLDLLLLTWAAGAMDALSYIRSGVFTANMTGNTVVLGLALAGLDRSRLAACVLSLCAFAFGALVAAVVLIHTVRDAEWARDLRMGIALELPFAALFTVLSWAEPAAVPGRPDAALIALPAFALGIQSVAVRRLQIAGVVTTFITGTITTAALSVVRATEPGDYGSPNSPLLLGATFLSYLLAAGAAAGLNRYQPAIVVVLPVVLLTIVLIRAYLPLSQRADG